jgi:PHD/YefM family antitoxin component YafN of YafNO toxin-antitoxin module
MREMNVVQMRRSIAKLARELEDEGEPVLLKLGSTPVGVIVSLRDFRERFALEDDKAARRKLVAEILGDRRRVSGPRIDKVLDEVRRPR